jgi:hypothetical protein
MTTEKFNLVFCHTQNGRNICQRPPEIEGVEWLAIPGSWKASINYYSEEEAALVPDSACANLPEYCWIPDKFKDAEALGIAEVMKDNKSCLAFHYCTRNPGGTVDVKTELIRQSEEEK